jgi:hypothetical protein
MSMISTTSTTFSDTLNIMVRKVLESEMCLQQNNELEFIYFIFLGCILLRYLHILYKHTTQKLYICDPAKVVSCVCGSHMYSFCVVYLYSILNLYVLCRIK